MTFRARCFPANQRVLLASKCRAFTEPLHHMASAITNEKAGCFAPGFYCSTTVNPSGFGDETNRFVNRFQGHGSASAGFLCALFHDLIKEGFITAESVIALLQFGQHTGNGFCHLALQMTVHFAFKMLLQLWNALTGNRRENIQQVGKPALFWMS